MPTNLEIVIDCSNPRELSQFWQQALSYREQWAADDLVVLVPERGPGAPLLLQAVPEPKATKNRMHLDLVCDNVEAEVARLDALGGQRTHTGLRRYGPTEWVTMMDPEGNEFCVSTGVPDSQRHK